MRRLAGLVLGLISAGPASASALAFDGSANLVCVPQEAMECTIGAGCERASADALGIPNFVAIDFDDKKLRDDTGELPDETSIENIRKVDGKLILQGAERGRGWSIVIDQQNGRMTATTSGVDDVGERFGFILFGVCRNDG